MLLDWNYVVKTFWLCVKAIPVTLEITIFSLLLAIIPAYGIAVQRLRCTKKSSVLRKIGSKFGAVYVSFMRGTPIVLQILLVYSLLPSLLNAFCKKFIPSVNIFNLNPIVYAIIVFTLNTIATLSEIFRSALQTVDKGQYEAALSAGLNHLQAYRRIIIPQALVSALPNLSDLNVALIKNTSLAFLMTVKDITAVAKIQAAYGFNYIESYLDIFVIYIIVCSAVQILYRIVEMKLREKR